MRASFANHYRRMIPQLLKLLEFRSNNDLHRPVIEALEFLKKYAHSKTRYYDSSEEIPIDGVLKAGAKEISHGNRQRGERTNQSRASRRLASRLRRRSARTRCTMKSVFLKPSEKDFAVKKFGAQAEGLPVVFDDDLRVRAAGQIAIATPMTIYPLTLKLNVKFTIRL